MEVVIGQKIQFNSRYCLGEGAYGKVFMGKNIQTGEQVAIKQIDIKYIEQQDKYIKQQIMNEIEILKKCDHINIVRFIDLLDTEKFIYIIIEYCKDGDLKELLGTRKLSELEAFNILSQIAEGYKELQRHCVIHRDLKPANILVHDGVYKIADFGFAKMISNYSTSHMLKSLVGSPYYMAPQLLSYQQYCYKCDIWSLAVIYYEMVFSELPWLASDPQQLLKKIIAQPIVTKLANAKISNFSQRFLEATLNVDEFRRPTWEEVYNMIQLSPLRNQTPIIQNPSVKKKNSIFDDSSSGAYTRSQLQSPDEKIINLRQELIFKHYLCQEIFVNLQQLIQLCDGKDVLLKLIYWLSTCVVKQSEQLIKICSEKDTNTLKYAKKEHESYTRLLQDISEYPVNFEIIFEIANEECLRLITEFLKIAQNKLTSINEPFILVIIEYLLNFVRVLRHSSENQNIDFEELANSKINENDSLLYLNILDTNLRAIII